MTLEIAANRKNEVPQPEWYTLEVNEAFTLLDASEEGLTSQ